MIEILSRRRRNWVRRPSGRHPARSAGFRVSCRARRRPHPPGGAPGEGSQVPFALDRRMKGGALTACRPESGEVAENTGTCGEAKLAPVPHNGPACHASHLG